MAVRDGPIQNQDWLVKGMLKSKITETHFAQIIDEDL